jgi:hypothetical protein
MTAITDHAVLVGLVYMPVRKVRETVNALREITNYSALYARNTEEDSD